MTWRARSASRRTRASMERSIALSTTLPSKSVSSSSVCSCRSNAARAVTAILSSRSAEAAGDVIFGTLVARVGEDLAGRSKLHQAPDPLLAGQHERRIVGDAGRL